MKKIAKNVQPEVEEVVRSPKEILESIYTATSQLDLMELYTRTMRHDLYEFRDVIVRRMEMEQHKFYSHPAIVIRSDGRVQILSNHNLNEMWHAAIENGPDFVEYLWNETANMFCMM